MHQFRKLTIVCSAVSVMFAMSACSGGAGSSLDPEPEPTPVKPTEKLSINISTSLTTRATDTAFEAGDGIGLFVVNYNADGTQAALKVTGNHVDNMKYTYNGTWTPATQTYWKDDVTHADFYIYYPYQTINSVDNLSFSVKADQSAVADYKAGDLLIGKTTNVAPTQNAVKIDAKHVMSQMVITLVAGNGFTESSLAAAQVAVKINRLKTQVAANLSTGVVTAKGDDVDITPLKEQGSYKAIIVPQTVGDGTLVTVNVDGRDYKLAKSSNFTAFEAGKKYKFTVTVSKTSNGVNVNITKWEDDGIDYGGTAE